MTDIHLIPKINMKDSHEIYIVGNKVQIREDE